MQNRSYLFLLFVLGLGVASAILYTRFAYKLGLDVKGGVQFTYAVKPIEGQTSKNVNIEDMLTKTQTILGNRISGMTGVVDSNIFVKKTGSGADANQIIVELPGFTDSAAAQKVIGTSASLKVYWPKTVNPDNPAITYREYTDVAAGNPDDPSVNFYDNYTHQTLTPGTPAYAKMLASWQLLVTGNDLQNATPEAIGNGSYKPDISFTSEGGTKMADWSTQYKGQGEKVAFVLDGKVLQIAPVEKTSTLGQQITVNGTFSAAYVKNLCALLNAGALPVDLQLLSSEKVDPSIGSFALNKMVFAGIIAFAVICLYLILYYGLPGLVATIALSLYVLFTITILKVLGATFSLAAIAGFVLSVGMAVDANILVFERFKEEIKKGRTLHDALNLGFNRALPAIFDSNICSIITSAVLVYFGTGPVKGFATTLILGVVISFFTAITVTRWLLFFVTESGLGNNIKLYALDRNWFGEHLESKANSEPLQIVNRAKTWFAITSVFIIGAAVFMAIGGLKYNVEFLGGLESSYVRTSDFPSQQQILQNLANSGVKGSNVQFSRDEKGQVLANITVPGTGFSKMNDDQRNAVLVKDAGLPASAKALNSSFVSPTVQHETTTNAVYGVIFSFGAIIIYLGIRFGMMLGSIKNGMRFGMTAIIAGAKDVFVIFGVAAFIGKILGWEISSLFITAMLTVIGFTVHDKIVIFDRIRENLRKPLTGETFEHLANRSVTQSIARSINTAAAVVVTLGILVVFGSATTDLRFFLIVMLSGIAWGTYSSIFTAAPLLNWWEATVARKYGEGATLLASARSEMSRAKINIGQVVMPTTPQGTPAEADPNAQKTYGQVRRRASAVQRSTRELDD